MKNHITKAVAVMMAVLMLMGTVPASALPVLAVGTSSSDTTTVTNSGSIFDNVTLGKDTVSNTESYAADAEAQSTSGNGGKDAAGKTIVNDTYSPYEPTATNDPNHPFLPGNAAWIDLKQIYYGAPATQNYPLTAWSANTSVYNITGTGKYYENVLYEYDGVTYGAAEGKEIFAFPDLNLIDEYLWAGQETTVYRDYENAMDDNKDGTDPELGNYLNVTQNGIADSETNKLTVGEDGKTDTTNIASSVASKNGTRAYVYNRYDAMQGKWGLTLDKNVQSVTWTPTLQRGYYGKNLPLDASELYLTDTPYLYFSTEALDSTQIAISLLIGTPVQSEKLSGTVIDGSNNLAQTNVTGLTKPEYVYRWYTITDNELRPGIDKDGDGVNETLDYDMTPNVHISDVVMENNLVEVGENDIAKTLGYIANGGYTSEGYGIGGTANVQISQDATRLDPIALAEKDADVKNIDELYVNGSITGCIDFTNILPQLTAETVTGDNMAGNGRKGVKYRIAQVRVDTKTATDESGKTLEDSAFRINYLYFGPALSTVYTPQNTVGSEVNAANWQYAAKTPNDGYGNSVDNANDVARHIHLNDFGTTYDSSYTNGWENGQAVSITNTPNDPQKITIDTYGKGNGQLIISTDDSLTSTTDGDKTVYSSFAIENSFSTSFTNQKVNTDGTLTRKHGIWTYTDVNGETVKLEAIQNGTNGDWYVSVGIPILKWVDVLGNSRKMSYTLTMERYAEALTVEKNGVSSDQKRNGQYIKPNFCLWGNDDGALGAGHAYFGARYKNEDMICVFGEDGYYQSDRQTGYSTQLIDATIGKSVIYNEPLLQTLYSVVPDSNGNYAIDSTVGQYYEYVDEDGVSYYKSVADGKFYTGGSFKSADGFDVWAYVKPDDETNKWYCYDPAKNKLFTWGGYEVTDFDLSQYTPGYVFEEATVNDWALTPVCTTTESWFDLLRSPYTLSGNRVALGTNTNTGIGENQRGYMFVTTLRVVVPLGAVMSFQNMKGDGNSAGLNMYSTEGHIVNAYDGGTGAQPNIDLNGTINEYTANSGSGTTANGTATGTLREDASAYGPFINGSYYTIYDLLDTEELNKKKSDGNPYNSRDLTVYGVPYTAYDISSNGGAAADGNLPIYSYPSGNITWYESTGTFQALYGGTVQGGIVNSEIIGRIPANTEFMVYGRISMLHVSTDEKTFSGKKEVWGLVGVMKKNEVTDIGWVLLQAGDTAYASQNSTTMNFVFDGYWGDDKSDSYTYSRWTYDFKTEQARLFAMLKGKWLFSNASEGYQLYNTSGNPTKSYYYRDGYDGVTVSTNKAVSASSPDSVDGDDIVFNKDGNFVPALQFANMDRSTYSNTTNSIATNIKTQNTTDMQFNISDSTGWQAAGISRTLTSPIRLKITPSGDEKTWPVLYYDFDVPTADAACRIAVTMNVNGTLKMYYVSPSGLSESAHSYWGSNTTSYCGYLSFKEIMATAGYTLGEFPSTGGDSNTEVIQVLAASMQLTNSTASTVNIRRLEVWQDETAYLDKLYVEGGTQNSANGVAANAKIADGFNIINDAFYYTHDETDTSADEKTNLYRKNNSNKGWSGSVRLYNEDGKTSADNIYTGVASDSQEGIYEYRTALGHLRVWIQPGRKADMLFTSDRSFSTNNYRYLYYSYSMRDVEYGISAEENDNANGDNGFCIALKQAQSGSNTAYLEQEGEFVYYDKTVNYLDGNNTSVDRLTYSTTVSAAVDLQSLENLDSINQIVVYMNNSTNSTAEFYLNYLILSNVQPSGVVSEELQETQVQYYYMMDNTGDRYSARFPTLDNVTGAVTGSNCDTDRVNPIIIERGAQFYEGTFFNGDPLGSYGAHDDGEVNGEVEDGYGGTLGGYGNTYDQVTVDDGVDGEIYKYIRQIWFYDTASNGEDKDILDYYEYKESNGDGTANKYDLTWSYGRWASSEESRLNTMYISTGDTSKGEKEDYIYGNLVYRYATENYVLLRSGIEPKRIPTYFDANGGEFIYDGSSKDVKNLDAVSENSYYINGTVLQGYFQDPATYATMYDDGDETNGIDYIVKPGYTFSHWEHYNHDGTLDKEFNTADSTTPAKLWAYIKKQSPEVDYFVAVWIPNTEDTGKINTATFYKNDTISADNVLTTRETTNDELNLNGSYTFTFPKDVFVKNGNTTQRIYGWREVIEKTTDENGNVTSITKGDKVYGQADKVYLLKDTEFVPEFDSTEVTTHTIKTYGAKLYVLTTNGNLHPVESHDAVMEPIYALKENSDEDKTNIIGYKYSNVMNQWHLVAVPDAVQDGSFWTAGMETNGYVYVTEGTPTVLSDDIKSYSFTALQDISITYGTLTLPDFHAEQDKIYVSTKAMNDPTSRELKLRTMFTTTNKHVSIVASGTLVTKDTYVSSVNLFEDMCVDMTTLNSSTLELGSYQSPKPNTVRLVQATARSELNEYYLRVTETKGKALTYYGRGYVIYQLTNDDGVVTNPNEYHVAYSDVVAFTTLPAAT